MGLFKIDFSSGVPIYQQLEENIIQYISFGVYRADEPLPSIRAMAKEIEVNPNTIQKTYASLEEKNIIYTVPRKGVFVSGDKRGMSAIKTIHSNNFKKSSIAARQVGVSREEQLEIINYVFGGDLND